MFQPVYCSYKIELSNISFCFSVASDIDECKDNKGGCHQVCVNTEGSYFCTCWQGFRYDSFSDTCQGEISFNSCISLCTKTKKIKGKINFKKALLKITVINA